MANKPRHLLTPSNRDEAADVQPQPLRYSIVAVPAPATNTRSKLPATGHRCIFETRPSWQPKSTDFEHAGEQDRQRYPFQLPGCGADQQCRKLNSGCDRYNLHISPDLAERKEVDPSYITDGLNDAQPSQDGHYWLRAYPFRSQHHYHNPVSARRNGRCKGDNRMTMAMIVEGKVLKASGSWMRALAKPGNKTSDIGASSSDAGSRAKSLPTRYEPGGQSRDLHR